MSVLHQKRPVSAGPFEREPVGLGRLLSEGFSDAVSGEEIRSRCVDWLTERLAGAGVALGTVDQEIVEVLADEGWSVAQVVAGWVSRAHTPRAITEKAMRFSDDPLAPVSAQFPLTRPALAPPSDTEGPSGPGTRPFGLRHVRAMPEPTVPAYVYSHEQQVSVAEDGNETPMVMLFPTMEWSSRSDNDGDEGPSEDWGNDFTPDHPVRA